ncbi:MAG: adenylate/guanylate cyclase domain-containing protein [Mariprofundaceae bacterium]
MSESTYGPVNLLEVEEVAPRFPVRWRWTMLVGFTVALTVLVLALVILDMERDAWVQSQESQAEVLVERLGNELKLPMLSRSAAEVDVIVRGFLQSVPAVMSAQVQYTRGQSKRFGVGFSGLDVDLLTQLKGTDQVLRLDSEHLWFAKKIKYDSSVLGSVAVLYSEDAWEALAGRLMKRMFLAAALVIVLAGILVYWIAGRMSRPMEMLAAAAGQVAAGDYSVRLPVQGNDEVSDAMGQFNRMTEELAHKENIRGVFQRYLNPKLVSEVFEGGTAYVENRRQDMTVLFADMVGFTSFSESSEPEEVVEVLNKHFEVFHRIIDYFGGHVDKYIGDAVMAVFNHPNEDPDHAKHATMAALAMVVACQKLGVLRKNGESIAFRAGLNRGHAIVGSIGAAERLEYTVIGDTVNVASRMGGLGEGGEVVLSHATFMHLGEGFAFDSMGEQTIKGVQHAIECGRVLESDADMHQKIAHSVALAFDLTLPSGVRLKVGEIS